MKRLIDIFFSTLGLLLFSPVLLTAASLIKLEDGGPVYFRGVRVGRYGKPFRIYKFRTMVANADRIGPSSTAADDARITKIGTFIRRLNLDELAQFVNVLKGEMSIVGPRPQIPWAVERYTEEEQKILSVRPGITDWATVWIQDEGELLRGSQNPDHDYLEKIWPIKRKLQLKYIRERSTWIDIKIMFMTLKVHLINRILSRPRSDAILRELVEARLDSVSKDAKSPS